MAAPYIPKLDDKIRQGSKELTFFKNLKSFFGMELINLMCTMHFPFFGVSAKTLNGNYTELSVLTFQQTTIAQSLLTEFKCFSLSQGRLIEKLKIYIFSQMVRPFDRFDLINSIVRFKKFD